MLLPEYDDADATEIAARIQSKDWKVEEVLQAAIERIDTRNVTLNAVVYRAFEEALADTKKRELRGPFAGVPFLLKDFGASWAGHPLSCGSRFLKNFVPGEDSHIVNRFRQAGLIFLGKTNTPEYGLMGVTEPALFGPCRNPWNTLHTTGGSSGGAAAARVTVVGETD